MYTIDPELKMDALIQSLRRQEKAVSEYQINTDGFSIALALQEAKEGGKTSALAKELRERIQAENTQKEKSQLYLDAVLAQLDGEDIEALLLQYPVPTQ